MIYIIKLVCLDLFISPLIGAIFSYIVYAIVQYHLIIRYAYNIFSRQKREIYNNTIGCDIERYKEKLNFAKTEIEDLKKRLILTAMIFNKKLNRYIKKLDYEFAILRCLNNWVEREASKNILRIIQK